MPEIHVNTTIRFDPRKVALLRWFAVGVVVLLLAGFWRLQVARADYYANLADRNRIRTLPLLAPRGLIYDRDNNLLVDNYPSFSIILIRDNLDEVQNSLAPIARGLHLNLRSLEKRLKEFESTASHTSIVLKNEATLADIAFVEAHQIDFPELELVRMFRRRYPPNQLAAHLIGYVGKASRKEVEQRGHDPSDVVGKMGLERLYNDTLMGQSGQRRVIVDSRGKLVELLGTDPATPGKDLVLTIDPDVQLAAERVLQGHKGAVVALDPRTGDILAMTSQPTFDPNLFAVQVPPAEWRKLIENPDKPLFNRAIQAQISPGSVFKIVVAAAALEEEIITSDTTVHCPGWAKHYDRIFRCWAPGGHGTVNLHKALVQSCDVYFYRLGKRLGIERIAQYAKKFGLGKPTGVDMPSEAGGLVPSPEWAQQVRKSKWYAGETISVAIGQGPILTTPLQLAHTVGGIASGGLFARPRLHANGDPIKPRKVKLAPATILKITNALWGVVNEPRGTATIARLPGIDLAGKTGTTQVIGYEALAKLRGPRGKNLSPNAWFVGFAPRRNPEIVVAVFLENGGSGVVAAPLGSEVIRAYYKKMGREALRQVASSHGTSPASSAPASGSLIRRGND